MNTNIAEAIALLKQQGILPESSESTESTESTDTVSDETIDSHGTDGVDAELRRVYSKYLSKYQVMRAKTVKLDKRNHEDRLELDRIAALPKEQQAKARAVALKAKRDRVLMGFLSGARCKFGPFEVRPSHVNPSNIVILGIGRQYPVTLPKSHVAQIIEALKAYA